MAKPAVADADSEQGDFGDPLPFNPHFKGPIKNRSCTDILCLFLFVAFIAGWAVVAYFAYSAGDPKNLLHPTDSEGNVCGHGKYADKPFLYFFDITKCAKVGAAVTGCNTPQVCVKQCPDINAYCVKDNCRFNQFKSKDLICVGEVKESENVEENLKRNDYKCAEYYIKSTPLAGRCLPTGIDFLQEIKDVKVEPGTGEKVAKNLAEFLNARDVAVRMFQDFAAAWWMMIIFLLFSMVVSFLWILLMRWIAGIMVFLSIILVVALLGFAAGFSFYTYYQIDRNLEVDAFKSQLITKLDTFTSSKTTWLVSGIIFGAIWLIMLLMLIFLRKRIILAIALIKEGSKAVGSTISSLFFPLFPYLLQLAVFAFWGSVAVYIASSGKARAYATDANGNTTKCDLKEEGVDFSKCMFSKYEGEDNLFRAQIYNLFGLFWSLFFVVGLGQVSLAGAFASYYWAFNKSKDVPYFAVAGGMYRAFRFHLGSIAFGSLLIAIVRMIRVMLDYIDQQCKKYKNTFTKVIMMCCKCCFWCLERFLRFISKNAYIMMSVYGKNFCTSAKDSFKLLMRNVIRVVVLDKVTDYLLLLGKLVVVGLTAVAALFFFKGDVKYVKDYSPDLNYYFLPVITVTIGSYLIATGFFNVYSMAVDTLFLCFLEDCERNDGSPERPYYMSRELMKILGKKNKFREQS